MKMKRILSLLLALVMVFALAACGSTDTPAPGTSGGDVNNPPEDIELTATQQIIQEAQGMTMEELAAKAIEESNGKTFYGLGNSSRGATALPLFIEYLQTIDPSYNMTYEWQQPKNNKIFDQLTSDSLKDVGTFAMTLIQDGNQIESKMVQTGILDTFIPKEWAEANSTTAEEYEGYLPLQTLNKVFMYNNTGDKTYDNVWDFVGEGEHGLYMDIDSELVGKNFLYMLTEDTYATMLKDAFDALSFDYYLVRAETEEVTETVTDEETGEETEETNDQVTEATMADAKEIADGIAEAVEGGADFAETVSGEIEDAEITEYENAFGYSVSSNFSDDFSEWVLDGSRQAGDVAVIESADTGYYVVVFHSRNDNSSYNGVSFRHILIQVDDADEDGEISDEERQSAEDEINEIYSDWQDNEATEDSFAELANTYSDDSRSNGSSTNGSSGGLYEHVAVNQMVDGINDWIFDSERQPGDTEIIYVEASNYTGYHLVYFVGTDDYNYHDCLAQYGLGSAGAPEGLRQQDYTAWEDELFAQFPVSINGFINWFAKV